MKMAGNCTSLPFGDTHFASPGAATPDDIFGVLEALEGVCGEYTAVTNSSGASELPLSSTKSKRRRMSTVEEYGGGNSDGQQKVSHITVERNRRKQMNEHLIVLRSLMPCFYVKKGDQASIIGGMVDYITELQQILQTLEAKKQRKVYSEVLSPRLISSPGPRTFPLSLRKPPISPRPSLPISPTTPKRLPRQSILLPLQPISNSYLSPFASPSPSSTSDKANELVASSKSAIAEVEVKFAGANLLLETHSTRLPSQATKIIALLEDLSLEILQVNINIVDEAMVNSFTIKIGIECKLSAEDLAQHVQQTFC